MSPYLNHFVVEWWLKHFTKVLNNSASLPSDLERFANINLLGQIVAALSLVKFSWSGP